MNDDSQSIQDTLKSLIEQTYHIEREYRALTAAYEGLKAFTQDIIEPIGAALWVTDIDKEITLQNAHASQNSDLLKEVNLSKPNQEIEQNGRTFAVKITQKEPHFIILATDITDEKRAERLASMGAVAAHLSHEIRNPIGSISLLTSSLLKRIEPKNKALIEEIQKAVFRVERIIKATLLFTKGVQPNRQIWSLERLKRGIEAAVEQYAFNKEIGLDLSGFEGDINGDIDLLDVVFSNLVFNAIDAIEESEDDEGKVSLKHELIGSEHYFYISDTGVAISKDAVFEPFKTTKLKGNGLGLALSIEIINAHKGSISLQNSPKLFTLILPS